MIDPGIRAQALELLRAGESTMRIEKALGVSSPSVRRWAKLAGMVLERGRVGGLSESNQWRRGARSESHPRLAPDDDFVDDNGRLTYAGRVLISIRRRERCSMQQIAGEVGVAVSTVSRELARGVDEQGRYRAKQAQRRCEVARQRPKPSKLTPGSWLRSHVVARLNEKHSPEQISSRLAREFPDDEDKRVSHETIYQALYVQGAGSLRHELAVEKALRQGRTTRRPRSKLGPRTNRSWIGDATITNRPPEAADRAVPGHWEGDLVIGGDLRSALITLNERHARYTLIRRIGIHDTATVTSQLSEMIASLPAALFKTLTWDQGVEMAAHKCVTTATGCPVFFCDPHSPWQRPTNENGNGLIRDYYPKGTDFNRVTDEDIALMEHQLNTRPREVLNFATPAEILNQLLTVATTT